MDEAREPGRLVIGTTSDREDRPATLRAAGFNRHTFWCGQSGSGKTYALGVVLEQLLLHTELPVLILDPNGDFVRLGRIHPDVPEPAAARLRERAPLVFRSTRGEGDRLRTRFFDMSLPSRAAVLRLDPIADAEEYNVMLRIDELGAPSQTDYLSALRESGDPGRALLATRIENLQVLEWELWALGEESITDVIDRRPATAVLEIGGFDHAIEAQVAALAVLEHLWRTREQRRPILVVIDEAHNLCPPTSETAVGRALTEQIVQIAAEGRKFGLWLLISTQRPAKIHPNVLSQCDNLGLMRMSAPRDLAELANVFGYAPEHLLSESPHFRKGQALFAGGFVDEPTVVQVGRRLTEEGGSDQQVPGI